MSATHDNWALGSGNWREKERTRSSSSDQSPEPSAQCPLSGQRLGPSAQGPRFARGVTLIELVISIVIVAIAAAAVLGVLSLLAKGSAQAMIRNQAVAIATAYLEEIRLKNFTADGVEASRDLYDDISDYNGLINVGAREQLDNPIANLNQYTVTITVGPGTLGGVPAASVRRIDVNVTHPDGVNMTVSGYRTAL